MTEPTQPGLAVRAPDELQGLVDRGVLTESQLTAVRQALRQGAPAQPPLRERVPWAEIAGYLGGALVLTGAVLLIATSWNKLSELARSGLVGLFAAILLVAGVVAAGGPSKLWSARRSPQDARLRLAGALLALGAVTTTIAVQVALPEGDRVWDLALAGGFGLLIAAAGYALLPTVFGLAASMGLLLVTVLAGLDTIVPLTALEVGLGLIGCGTLVAVPALLRVLPHRLTGLALGAAVALVGAQQPLGDPGLELWAYALTFGLGVILLALYGWIRSWVPLVLGVIAIAVAVPEAIQDVTNGAVGGAAVPLIAGLILLVASGFGLRARKAGRLH